ncbi:translocation and assembly module TamB [Gammaproteobacteria bacterium]
MVLIVRPDSGNAIATPVPPAKITLQAGDQVLAVDSTNEITHVQQPNVSRSFTLTWLKPRWLPFTVLSLLSLPLLLLLLVFFLLQIDLFRAPLLNWGQRTLQAQGIDIQLEGLRGIVPINFTLDRLTLADAKGIWLELTGLHLAWRPLELFRSRIHIDEFSLGALAMERWPLITEIEKSQKNESWLMKKPPVILVEKFIVPSITFSAALLGESVRLSLEGEASVNVKAGTRILLKLHRLDRKIATLSLLANFDTQEILEVNLVVEEKSDLIKHLVKLPITGGMELQLTGRGPLGQWPGNLKLRLPGIVELSTSLHVLMKKNKEIQFNGTFSPAVELIKPRIAALLDAPVPFGLDIRLDAPKPILRQLWMDIPMGRLEVHGENSSDFMIRFPIKTKTINFLPPAVSALLGANADLKANISTDENRRIHLEKLTVHGQALDFVATGDVFLKNDQIALRSELKLPQLKVLNSGAGIPVAGSLTANLNLAGWLREPDIQVALEGRGLKYGGQDLQDLHAKLNAKQLFSDLKGDLDVGLGPLSQTVGLHARFKRLNSQVAIQDLLLSAPATYLRGELNLDVVNLLLQGNLLGRVDNLGALHYWSGQEHLKGALDFAVTLTTPKTQSMDLRAHGTAISGEFGRVDEFKTDVVIANARALSGVDLHAEAKGIVRNEYRIKSVTVTAQGDARRLDLNTRINAESPSDTHLDLDAQLAWVGQQRRALLRNLDGAWKGKLFHLKMPLELTADARETRVNHLWLDFAGANLNAMARFGTREVAAEVMFDSLPLQLLTELSGTNLEGMGKAKLHLTGTRSDPRIQLEVEARDLKAFAVEGKKLPPVQVNATAELISGQFSADLGIAGLTENPVKINLALPLQLTLDPLNFHFDARAPLRGSLVGVADIGRLSRFFILDDQKLTGLAQATVRLDGNLGDPKLGGEIHVRNGHYENGLTGTLIKDLNLDIQLAGQSLTIAALNANDGGKGRLHAQGGVVLDHQRGDFRLDTQIDLDKATLMRSDNASATFSGHLALMGDRQGSEIKGNVNVIKSEIRLPERMTPDVPKLEVQETPVRGKRKVTPPQTVRNPSYPVKLNIKVDIPSRTFARGRGLDSEWRGQIEIAGLAQEPRATGQLWIQRGVFDFLDRRFKIQEGNIDFHGDYPPVPNINLKADVAGHDMLAILSVTGVATNPKVTLESQPSLPQDEILARLLFDREIKNISVLQALKLAMAVQTLAGRTGGRGLDLLGRTRDSLGLDTLDMDSKDSENKSVKAGKYLRENVYLEVESGLGNGASKARVEKEISRQLSVETSVDQDSNSSFGINWKVDY